MAWGSSALIAAGANPLNPRYAVTAVAGLSALATYRAVTKLGYDDFGVEVNSFHMLSDVLAHAEKGSAWITLQTHLNIVAVAAMKELGGIIITNGRSPDEGTLRKAAEEKIPILVTRLPSFEVAGRLYSLVTPGTKR